MDDIGAFQELMKVLTSGGTGNALMVFIAFMLWKLDRRVGVLEMALGVVKVPQVALRQDGEKGFTRISGIVGVLVAAAILAGCSQMSGQVLGASLNIGGFTFGVSGAFPTGQALPPPADDPIP